MGLPGRACDWVSAFAGSHCVCVYVSEREVVVNGRGRLLGLDSALLGGKEWARETGEPTF